jgi:hypothetical protein
MSPAIADIPMSGIEGLAGAHAVGTPLTAGIAIPSQASSRQSARQQICRACDSAQENQHSLDPSEAVRTVAKGMK